MAFPDHYVSSPLYIYEPRYRLLAKRALETGEPFILLYNDKSTVGTAVRIKEVYNLQDGGLSVELIGVHRVKVLETKIKDDNFGLYGAEVKYIEDSDIDSETATSIRLESVKLLTKCIEQLGIDVSDIPTNNKNYIWWLVDILPAPPQLKQYWLEVSTYCERLLMIIKWCNELQHKIKMAQSQKE